MRKGFYGWDARIYRIWVGMKNRCQNANNYSYANYGGRGIAVCDEWQDYQSFLDWSLANGYGENLSIDRIDNNGNYCPENCRWATRREQNCNTRQNHYLTYNGVTQTISQWAECVGITRSALKCRLENGWAIDRALTVLDGKYEQATKYTYRGETHTLKEWSTILGINRGTLERRVYAHPGQAEKIFAPLPEKVPLITYDGKTQSRSAWARELGIDVSWLCKQFNKKKRSFEDIIAAHIIKTKEIGEIV